VSRTHYIAEIEHRIAGIPCLIGVTDYEGYSPAYVSGPPENCYPSEGGTGDFEILDRRGYRAKWLERKLTAKEEDLIQEAIFEYMEND
jgi:hypothetical protein